MAWRGLPIQEFWDLKNAFKQPTAKSSHLLEGARNAPVGLWSVHRGRSPTVWKHRMAQGVRPPAPMSFPFSLSLPQHP